MISGVIYRHPCGHMQNLMDFVNSTIKKIDRENKFCIIVGDLLKLDSHIVQIVVQMLWGPSTFSLIFYDLLKLLTSHKLITLILYLHP